MSQTETNDIAEKNRRTGRIVLCVVIFMVALSFASVPLYSLFCRITGFDGTTQRSDSLPDKVLERTVSISFNTDISRDIPWRVRAEVPSLSVHIGQQGLVNFIAENKGRNPVTGTALYNVVPPKAGKYFKKIQCFCFNEQLLNPGQKVNMPVVFYIDPSIADDPSMEDVTNITLSYSFYKAETEALERALEAFYNTPSDTDTISGKQN